MTELSIYDNDPTIYLFTSLTAGSSHIVTATSRIETILRANKIPFKGVDTATDELAKKLFQRRANGKKLPLIVKQGYVLGGITEIEEWNEYDEIREALGVTSAFTPFPAKPGPSPMAAPATTTSSFSSTSTVTKKENVVTPSLETNLALRELGAEAAKKAASLKPTPSNIKTTNPLLAEKTNTPTSVASKKSPTKEDLGGILSPKSVPLPETPKLATPATPTTTTTTTTSKDTEAATSVVKEEVKPATSSTTTKDTKAVTPSTTKAKDAKDTKAKDAKAKDSKTKDTKAKTTSSKDSKSKSTRKPTGGLFGLGKPAAKSRPKSSSNKDTKSKDAKSKSTKGTKSATTQPSIPKLSDVQKPVHAPPSMHDDAKNPALGAGPISSAKKEEKEEEEDGSEEDDASDEESSEDEEDDAKTAAEAPAKAAGKAAAATGESSKEEKDDSDDEDDESEDEVSENEKKPAPLTTKDGSATQTRKEEAEESEEEEEEEEEEESEEDEDDEEEEEEEETPKTQKQGAKDASKAGVSVKD